MKTIIVVVMCSFLCIGVLTYPLDDSLKTDLRVGESDTVPLNVVESIATPLKVETEKSDEVADAHTLLKRAIVPELSFEERTPARGGGGGGGGCHGHGCHGNNYNKGHNYHGGHNNGGHNNGGHKKSHGGHRW